MRRIVLNSVAGLALFAGTCSLAQAQHHHGGGFGGGFGGHMGGGFGGPMAHHGMPMQPMMHTRMHHVASPAWLPYTPAPFVPEPVVPEPEETPDNDGVRLSEVRPGGPADRAGLQAGDVLLSVGGVRTRTVRELRVALNQVDGEVEVIFVNCENGQTESLTVVPTDSMIGVTCE